MRASPWAPALETLTRSVVPICRSRTNTSGCPLVSPGTRLVAADQKATKRPSALIAGEGELLPSAWAPVVVRLTRSVLPVSRSRTNTSTTPLVSPGTRLVAPDWKATKRPSALIAGNPLVSLPSSPALETLTRSVVPACRSRTNTSKCPVVSPGTRLVAADMKAMKRPSALIAGLKLSPSPWALALETLTRSVLPAWRSRTNTS